MRRSHDEFAAFVAGLPADALETQSGASEWAVADVLSHLGSAAEIGFDTLTTGHADMAGAQVIWDRWNALSPGQKASSFISAETRLVEAFEAMDEETLANKRIDVGFLPAPIDVGFFAAMRLSEVGQHIWDVAVAFDPGAAVPAYLVPILLEALPEFAAFFARGIDKTGSITVETTAPARRYVLEVRADGATLADGAALLDGEAQRGDALLALPAESLVRLTGGRLAPDHTPAAVRVEGDFTLDDLRRVFPGY